ncbi:hypothetical protein GCM10023186_29340 [Hymenobacter koreensis]|uniref:Uncharacterized protein n=1 Tax=Hymenobacter koreensis TaxID=1084523 RepID=A0ABP8J611_9BACT
MVSQYIIGQGSSGWKVREKCEEAVGEGGHNGQVGSGFLRMGRASSVTAEWAYETDFWGLGLDAAN